MLTQKRKCSQYISKAMGFAGDLFSKKADKLNRFGYITSHGSSSHVEKREFNLLLLFVLLFIFLFSPLWAYGQIAVSGLTINADEMIQEAKPKIIQLKGNIQAIFNAHYLSSDKATIFIKEKKIIASGNVILQNERVYIEADKLNFNYKKGIGTLYNAFVQSGQVTFEGDVIHKVGKDKYKSIDARYSTCTNCPPSWSFTGTEIDAEIGGYAYIKYPMLRISDIPVFWLPGLWVPLKTKRQSGVLTPSFQQGSKSGSALEFSYFWAISRSKDMTLSTKIYENRGIKGLFEYRYVLDKNRRGQLNGGILQDQAFQNNDSKNSDNSQRRLERSFLEYDHYYKFPSHLIQRTSLSYVSDLRYIRDFPEDMRFNTSNNIRKDRNKAALEASRPSLENNVSLTKNTEDQSMSIEGAFNINLLQENPEAGNKEAIHRVPEIHYSLMERELGETGMMFSLDLRYTHFLRNEWAYDNVCDNMTCLDDKTVLFKGVNFDHPSFNLTERRIDSKRDGTFDPANDLIRTGQRFIFSPTFNYPILLGNKFELVPSATYYHKLYHFNPHSEDSSYKKNTSQNHLETQLSLSTRFSRIFGDSLNPKATIYKHEIEPQLSYVNIPTHRISNHNFFGNFEAQPFSQSTETLTDFDFFGDEKIQFDYYDRFFLKKIINFGITNRIVRRRLQYGKPTYLEIASLQISQTYDFNEENRNTPQPWGSINSLFKLRLDNVELHASAFHFPYAKMMKTSSRLRLKSNLGNFVEFIYSLDPKVDEDNNYDFDNRNETGGLGVGLATKYFVFAGGFNYSFKDYNIQSWNATTVLKPPGDCWAIQVSVSQSPDSDEIISTYDILFEFGDNL